jgi:putative restriction endonuclease
MAPKFGYAPQTLNEWVKEAETDSGFRPGLRIINGGGRAEVQAAHIRPVAASGSDSVRNGLALSATVHWMFDRGLISVDEDHSIFVAKDKLPDTALRLINEERQLILPERFDARPHRNGLKYHREAVFKG